MERTLLHRRHHHHQQQQQQQEVINCSHVITTSPASCTIDSTNINNNEAPVLIQIGQAQPPLTPKAAFRSDNTPYPTTFVQADTSNFKQVVQMLTGSTTTTESPRAVAIPPIRTAPKKQQQQGFRLYERRNSLKNALMINTLGLLPGISSPRDAAAGFSPQNLFAHHHHHHHHNEALSPSVLNFPKLTLSSPVTPLNNDPFGKSSSEEERAIAKKGFYFHPSQTNTPRDSEPQLLPLFPVTSPRIPGAPS